MTTLDTLRQLQAEATPGPWYVSEAKEPPFGPTDPSVVFVDSEKTFIASTHLSPDAPRAYPDARLIALTPDISAELITVRTERDRIRDGIKTFLTGWTSGDAKTHDLITGLWALLDGEAKG